MGVSADQIAEVLGGTRILGRRVRRTVDLEDIVREGIPRESLDTVVGILGAGLAGEDVKLRNKIIPRATYQRVEKLNLQHSETVERIARLYALLKSVFQDARTAAKFLMTAHPELGGRVPFEVALTEVGGRQIEEIIERGLHGLPA